MKTVAQGESFNIYYNVRGLPSGEDVVVNIWDDVGTQLVSDQSLTEIPPAEGETHGTYYFNFTAPAYDTYACILCHYSDQSHVASKVVKVGSPIEKVFYCDLNLDAERQVEYVIYDYAGVESQSGIMYNLKNAFYVIISNVDPPYYFRVSPYIILKND